MDHGELSNRQSGHVDELFPDAFEVLVRLFGKADVQAKLGRLDLIFQHAEHWRKQYIAGLPDRRVKYLLIAEAPPWSEAGTPQFVLDPTSRPRTLLKALRKAFCATALPVNSPKLLATLAGSGFLIVDSIPFSMDYSSRRDRALYQALVNESVRTYLLPTLNSCGLALSGNLRVCFSVMKNARAIMNTLNRNLTLGSYRLTLTEEMIAVNGSNYPDAGRISALFGLPFSSP
jgi:hypothetical protein